MDRVVNILLVDDEQRNLDALDAILEHQGYHLLQATNADKALRLLLDHDVAAIVLDIKMPGVSGFELASLIKGTRKFREIPILFLTAYMVDDQDVLTGYGTGAVDYLMKPVKSQILRHKLAAFVELFTKTRALAELNATLEARVQERTAELERSEAALREAGRQKDAFLAMLAHELRNPLAPLRTGVDLLLQLPAAAPIAITVLTSMNRQLDHMVRLIDDLLDVSRISRGMLELRPESIDLRSVVGSAIDIVRPMLDHRAQTLAFDPPSDPVIAFIDPTRVAQIVGNLLHNASKYTPQSRAIRVELVASPGDVTIRVIDRGVGIPPDQLARVFEMFARIERAVPNANNGLGIGLALARQLTAMHGGLLSATSAGEGQGATFTLTLPLPSKPSDVAPVRGAAVPGAATHLNIVVVEDNVDAADLMQIWLESMGHQVAVARTGPEGVEVVTAARPDLVLCDIGLPGMDGAEVCRHVLALADRPRPVMVALTGWGMDADRKRTNDAGFDHHLVKPVALDKLRQILLDVRR